MDKNNQKAQKKEDKKSPQPEGEDYKVKYLRALADYHNLEKRVYRQEEEVFTRAKKDIVLKLLPFLDNLDKAETFIKDAGMRIVKDQFLKVLASEGIEELEVAGQEFNPQVAEAIDVVAGDKDNIVNEVVRRGYKLHGKVIRPAQVKVTKKA